MRFFPWLTEEFTSPLPPAELLRRVQQAIAPSRPPSWRTLFAGPPVEPFRGFVAANSFEVQRISNGRNSLPQVTGWVQLHPSGGSRVRLRHRLPLPALLFAAVWLGFVGLVAVRIVADLLSDGLPLVLDKPFWPLLIPTGLLTFGFLLFTMPFWWEINRSRPLLIKLLRLKAVPAS